MKKILVLLCLTLLTWFWMASAADDTVQDNGTTVDNTTAEIVAWETLKTDLNWEVENVDWVSNISLSFKDLNSKVLGWNFDIELPEWVEFVWVEKGSAMSDEDEVNGTLTDNIVTIEFSADWVTDNTDQLMILQLSNYNWEKLVVSEDNNEIYTEDDLPLAVWNIVIWDNATATTDEVATEEIVTEDEPIAVEESTETWATVKSGNIEKTETETKTWKTEVSLALLLLIILSSSLYLGKQKQRS